MLVDDKIKTLYNTLKQGGANVGKDAEEFSNWFLQPGDTGYQRRHEVWQTLSDGGAQVGQNYEQFRDWLNLGSSPSQVNKPSREERIKAIVGLNDMVDKSKDYVNSAKKRVNDILKTTQKPLNRGSVDIVLGDDGAPQIGHNTNVRVKQGFNAQTGKAEKQYTTESGNTYDSSAVANLEQSQKQAKEALTPMFEQEVSIDKKGNKVSKPKLEPTFDPKNGGIAAPPVYRDLMTGETYSQEEAKTDERVARGIKQASTTMPYDVKSANRKQVGDISSQIDKELDASLSKDAKTQDEKNYERLTTGNWFQRLGAALSLGNSGNALDAGGDKTMTANQMATGYHSNETFNLKAAQRSLKNAQRTIAEADHNAKSGSFGKWIESSFAGGAARGLGQKLFDLSTWDMGASDLTDNGELMIALDKFDSGKPLSKSQQMLLDAKATELATDAYFGSYVGRGYKAGGVTAESIPFMIEFCINPASTTGSAAANKMARYAVKRFGKKVVKNNAKKYVASKVATRVAGDVVGSAVMAATTGSLHTIADAEDRMNGQVQFGEKENGETEFSGRTKGVDAGTALGKAFVNQTIQNQSEMVGNYFAPALGVVGKGITKGLNKIGAGKVTKFMDDVAMSDVGRMVSDFEKHSQWNGPIGEYAEEVVGNVENALLVRDQTLDTKERTGVFNLEQNIDTFLGVSLMGGFLSGVKISGYRTPKYKAKKTMVNTSNNAAKIFGNDETWGGIRNTLTFGNEDDVKQTINDVLTNPDYNDEQKRAALEYAKSVETYKGMQRSEEKRRTDADADPIQNDAETSYDNGYSLETDQEMNDAKNMLDFKSQQFKHIFGIPEDEEIGSKFGDGVGALKQMDSDGMLDSEEKKKAAVDYLNAKATYDGMINHIQDDLDEKISASDTTIDGNANLDDGQIHPATMKLENRRVYVVGGNLVMNEDGTMIDADKSDESIIVRDADTGNIEFTDPRSVLSIDEAIDPAKEKEIAQQQIREQYAQQAADKIDGVLPFNIGDTYTLMDDSGTQHTYNILMDNGDGNVTVSIDGNEEQPFVVQKSAVQDMQENTSLSRLQQYEQDKAQQQIAEKQQQEEASRPAYNLNDEIAIHDENGNIVRGSVTANENDDGQIEVYSESPINGKKVNVFTREELDAINANNEEIAQEQGNIIDDILPFNPNDVYTILGEDGAQHQVQVIDADNNMAQVSIDGGNPTVINKADIQIGYDRTKTVGSAENAPATNNTTSDVEQHANNASSSENVQEGNDELIDRARGGDRDAIAQLDEYQIPYKNKNVYRHVGQEEVDKLLNGEEIKSRRVAGLIDVTSSSEPTTGASSDYRVTFNDSHDFDKHKGGVRMKNAELGDGFLENGSYSLNDVATIEKRNEDGTYTIVYSAKGSAETTPSEKNTEQPTDTRERDADNNLIYHKLPVEETIADLYDGSLDDNEVNAFVQANIKESEKNLKEITKRAPKITSNKAKYLADKQAWQQKLDEAKQIAEYWKAVEEEKQKITHTTQQELEAVQDELSGKNALEQLNGSAQSKEQFVEAFVRSAKFNPEDVMRESGMKVGDIKGMLAILRQDGMNIQEAAEELALKDEQENGGMYFGGDDTEARNAIIDGILSYGGNAKEKASTEEQRMIEDYIQELDVTFLDAYGLTFEEYLQYSEVEMPELLRKYTTFDDIPYINEHYEEIDNELTRLENENRRADTTAENGSDANSTEVLQETQPNDGEGTGDSNEQGSKTETGLQGNNEHEPVSEETSRSDVEPFTPNAKKEGEGIFDFANRVVDETKRKEEEEKVETNPTEKQKEAGNYKKGHINVDGFDVTIEQPKGSVRRGTDKDGKEWETVMHNTYGYIRGTESVDGDHIDIFLSDDPTEGKVFVVDQTNEDGTFDEHKVMYGFVNEEEARKAYLSNYSDGWQGLGNITEVSKEDFKKWINSSKRKTKPFAEYSIAKTEAPLEEIKQETEQNGTEKPSSTTKEEKSTDTKVEKNATHPTQEQIEKSKENIEDWGEEIAGARKNAMKELSQRIGNITLDDLIQLSLGKVYKKQDFKKMYEDGKISRQDALFLEALSQLIYSKKKPSGIKYSVKQKIVTWAENVNNILGVMNSYAEADTQEQKDKIIELASKETDGSNSQIKNIIDILEGVDYLNRGLGKAKIPLVKKFYDGVSYFVSVDGTSVIREKSYEDAINTAIKIAKQSRGDSDIEYGKNDFSWHSTKNHVVETGKYYVAYLKTGKSYPTTITHLTKEQAEETVATLTKKHGEGYAKMYPEKAAIPASFKPTIRNYADKTTYVIEDAPAFDTREGLDAYIDENFDTLVEKANVLVSSKVVEKGTTKENHVKLNIGHERGKSEIIVWVSTGKNSYEVVARGFKDYPEARGWANANQEYFDKQEEERKKTRKDFVFFKPEKERKGKDWRQGRDVTEAEFGITFGFRGVQFGNWTNQKDRQASINEAYDALMDMADILGISPKAISLNGELGIAFGSRGTGKANAHYESTNIVINLTKTRGTGSLAHEWWHALDNYFSRKGGVASGYMTDGNGYGGMVREEVENAFKAIVKAINNSSYGKRSNILGAYWGSKEEETARLFAEWMNYQLEKQGNNNSFLSRGVEKEDFESYKRTNYLLYKIGVDNSNKWIENHNEALSEEKKVPLQEIIPYEEYAKQSESLDGCPYPTREEIKETFEKPLKELFDIILEKQGEDDKKVLYMRGENPSREKQTKRNEQQAIGNELVDRIQASGIKVHIIGEEIEKVLKDTEGSSEIFKSNNGVIYGFVKDGEIYLDPTLIDANSPVHEYTHLWDAVVQKNNPELWKRGKELMKKLSIWQEVLNDENYADIKDNEDLVASEVHSRLAGEESEKIFQNAIDSSKGVIKKAEAYTLVEQVKQWLNNVWNAIKDTFTSWTREEADKVSLDEFVNMPLKNLLNGKSFKGVNIKSEEQTIVDDAKKAGTYLKAPNGNDSNLNEKQWVQVRTRAFKEWFGDWEKNPDEASKVVDENGEPKVVLHGTPNAGFYEFREDKIGSSNDAGWLGRGFYFYGNNPEYASQYGKGGRVMEVYLNIRNPYYATSEDMERLADANSEEASREFREILESEDYDGVYYNGDLNEEWVAFYPNQIKSAIDNSGTFDSNNPDIRYMKVKGKDGEKSLVGIHNISEEKLAKAINQGGLANPSAAVVNLDNGEHSGFGSISLIMPSSLVDKSKGKNSGTYTGDAWTPIYPNIEYYETKESKKKEEELFSFLDDDTRKYAITALHYANDGITNRRGNPLAVAFLHEKGIDVEVAKDNYNAGLEANNYINKNGLEAEYNTWVGNTLSGLGYDEKFEVGWSSSGNRILKKNTLENVSNWMKKQAKQRIGETSFPTDWILEQMAKLISLKQIQQRREELTSLEEVEDFRINLKEKIDKIAKEIGAWNAIDELKKKNSYINPFIEYDTLMYDVFSGITKGKSYEELNKYWGTNITEEVSDEIKQLSKDVAHAPRKYFETKFERPVYLNEFAAAVVPDNIDPELENSLKASGLDIFKYNMKDESSRTEAVRKATESRDDILFREGKSEEDLPEPKFNAKEMQSHVDELTKKLNLDNVVVLTSTEGLDEKKAKSKGWYDKNTGKITIVIPNNADLADVEKTLLHEAVAHYGLRQLLGNNFDSFLDEVYSLANKDVKNAIDKLAESKYKGNVRLATEEYMASLVEDINFEDAKDKGFWQKIKDAFISVLRKLGLVKPEAIGDNELRYTLWRNYQNLVNPNERNLFNKAEDIAMQYNLKVGEYTADDLGMVGKVSNVGEDSNGNILFRDGDPIEKERIEARKKYNQRMSQSFVQVKEAMQDSMQSLIEAMEAIWHGNGKKGHIEDIPGFENPYLGENRLSSVNENEVRTMGRNLFAPLMEDVSKLANNKEGYKDLVSYMMCKHGLERNVLMANKKGEQNFEAHKAKHPGTKMTLNDFIWKARKHDYSGITALMQEGEVEVAEQKAMSVVAEYETTHDTKNLWDKINAITNAILRKNQESGIISKEQYDNISKMYKYYIPLRGFDETTSSEAYAYINNKESAFNAPVKTARGRKSVADDPIAYLQNMAESVILQGNRNKLVKQPFLYFVQNHPSDLISISDLWLKYDDVSEDWVPVYPDTIGENDSKEEFESKMADFETKMKALADAEPEKYKHGKEAVDIPYRVLGDTNLNQHRVVVKVDGRDYILTVNGNPRLAQAINGITNPDNDISGSIGKIISLVGDVNRTLSAVYTTLQPDFIASNFVRDTIFSNTMVWVKESPKYAASYNRTFASLNPASMKSLFAKYRKNELDLTNWKEKYFKEFMENGGETGYARLADVDQHKEKVKKAIQALNKAIPMHEVRKVMTEWIGEIGRGIESQARFAAFITSRDMGRTIERSIWDAKEISVNFNKKGAGDKFLSENGQTFLGNSASLVSGLGRAGYIFWNAAIQGTFGNAIKYGIRNPNKAMGATAVMFALGMFVSSLGSAFGGGGDGDDNDYYNFTPFIRRYNLLIPILGSKSWIKLPLPIEYRAIYGMGELLGSTLFHGDELKVNDLLSQISQILPIDVMQGQQEGEFNIAKPFIPTVGKTASEIITNTGWNGLPIYKNTPFNQNYPEWTKSYKNANKEILGVTKELNAISGGNEYKKGTIDLNPAKIEYMLRGYGGGFWTLPDQLMKVGEVTLNKRDFDWRYFPLFNRVLANNDDQTTGRAINNTYFKLKEECEETKRLLNSYLKDTDLEKKDFSKEIDKLQNSTEYSHLEIYLEYRGMIDSYMSALKDITNENEKKLVEDDIYKAKKEFVQRIEDFDKEEKKQK